LEDPPKEVQWKFLMVTLYLPKAMYVLVSILPIL